MQIDAKSENINKRDPIQDQSVELMWWLCKYTIINTDEFKTWLKSC